MKRIHGVAVATALALTAVAAQPAAGQIVVAPECEVSGGGRIVTTAGDRATFGGSAELDDKESGQQLYVDNGPATQLRFRSITTDTMFCLEDGRRAEITGTGIANTDAGNEVVEYRIVMFDFGRTDVYRITLSNGYDSGEQIVVAGNIRMTFSEPPPP